MGSPQDMDVARAPLRIFIFDQMRARSHIFFRFMSTHHQLAPLYHPFWLAPFLGLENIADHFEHSEARRNELREVWRSWYGTHTYHDCRKTLEKNVVELEDQGRIVLGNEHCAFAMQQGIVLNAMNGKEYTLDELRPNPTYLPDWLFQTIIPILVIRHPIYTVPSYYRSVTAVSVIRPSDDEFTFCTSFRFIKMLFDLLRSENAGKPPIVVDGDDLLWRTDELMARLSEHVGIEKGGFRTQWDPTPESERSKNPIIAGFTKTMHDSKGIERPGEKPSKPDLETEFLEWSKSYGEEVAKQLKAHVETNLSDYEYLRRFKV